MSGIISGYGSRSGCNGDNNKPETEIFRNWRKTGRRGVGVAVNAFTSLDDDNEISARLSDVCRGGDGTDIYFA